MKQIRIENLKSRHIPVFTVSFALTNNIHWWRESSPFYYPNVLFNLETFDKEKASQLFEGTSCFLLTDSGGFQVISGKCNLDWETSLLKQIELNATKIFAFDTPPVKQVYGGALDNFTYLPDKETKEIIEKNLDVAIKQSEYLRDKHPEYRDRFCYILHAKNYEHLQYNMDLIQQKIGDKYDEYFPGGITYAIKGKDLLFITMAARHAYDNFITKGKYVHFLGMGSFYKMCVLVRNKITTFDSSSALQGARANAAINPINYKSTMFLNTKDFEYTSNFCQCPVCSRVDYKKLAEEDPTLVGRTLIAHNLWHMLKQNIILDSLPANIYTRKCKECFKLPENVVRCLEFCDDCDTMGLEIAYEKYKGFLKKDETKQDTLF